MKKFILMAIMVLCAQIPQAHAYVVNATLTADNHYALYYGDITGSNLTFVGRNETGVAGNPGQYNWSRPESYTFNAPYSSYLYVLAWDSGSQQSWIGQFSGPNGTFVSNTTNWLYTVAPQGNPGETVNSLPALNQVQSNIQNAQWATPLASAAYNASPWGIIPGITNTQAKYIWNDTLASSSNSDAHYVIFRTTSAVTPTPEPATMALFGMGLAGLGVLRRKQNKA